MMHAVILYFSVHMMSNSAAIDELTKLYANLQELGTRNNSSYSPLAYFILHQVINV